MALSPQFLDELKHRFTLSDVVGRQVKLVRHGREHTGRLRKKRPIKMAIGSNQDGSSSHKG